MSLEKKILNTKTAKKIKLTSQELGFLTYVSAVTFVAGVYTGLTNAQGVSPMPETISQIIKNAPFIVETTMGAAYGADIATDGRLLKSYEENKGEDLRVINGLILGAKIGLIKGGATFTAGYLMGDAMYKLLN